MTWIRSFGFLLFFLGVSAYKINVDFKPKEDEKKGETYALLVTGGVRWYASYRLEANVAAAYALLKKNGIPSENIVVMNYDYAVPHPRNPCKGQLFHSPEFENIYDPSSYDYKGLDVNPENVLSVLRGNSTGTKGGNGRVLNSTANDRIFVYFATDGLNVPPALAFQDMQRLWAADLWITLHWMKNNGKYSEMVIYAETDYGNLFLKDLPKDINVYAVTNTDNIDWFLVFPVFCELKHCGGTTACLATTFGFDYQNLTSHSDLYETTFHQQMASLRAMPAEEARDYETTLAEFGDMSIAQKPIGCFMGNGDSPLCH